MQCNWIVNKRLKSIPLIILRNDPHKINWWWMTGWKASSLRGRGLETIWKLTAVKQKWASPICVNSGFMANEVLRPSGKACWYLSSLHWDSINLEDWRLMHDSGEFRNTIIVQIPYIPRYWRVSPRKYSHSASCWFLLNSLECHTLVGRKSFNSLSCFVCILRSHYEHRGGRCLLSLWRGSIVCFPPSYIPRKGEWLLAEERTFNPLRPTCL